MRGLSSTSSDFLTILNNKNKNNISQSPWGLRTISFTFSNKYTALEMLCNIAEEKQKQKQENDDQNVKEENKEKQKYNITYTALYSRFIEWPLPTLTRCTNTLHIITNQLQELCKTIKTQRDNIIKDSNNNNNNNNNNINLHNLHYRRLYNICLWQRRHPLCILSPILDIFGEFLSCEEINNILEGLSQHIFNIMNNFSHILRCDILLTYQRLSLEQQLQLMEGFQQGGNEKKIIHMNISEKVPEPEIYIGEYIIKIPPRFGVSDISLEEYKEIRSAFELHKKAGLKRLMSYTG